LPKENVSFSLAEMPNFMKNADRIVGGEDAPEPIPWQASLGGYCGATILDVNTLLSAAHCFCIIDVEDNCVSINTNPDGQWIRVGSREKRSGGQVS
jgi:hypothetical protein